MSRLAPLQSVVERLSVYDSALFGAVEIVVRRLAALTPGTGVRTVAGWRHARRLGGFHASSERRELSRASVKIQVSVSVAHNVSCETQQHPLIFYPAKGTRIHFHAIREILVVQRAARGPRRCRDLVARDRRFRTERWLLGIERRLLRIKRRRLTINRWDGIRGLLRNLRSAHGQRRHLRSVNPGSAARTAGDQFPKSRRYQGLVGRGARRFLRCHR